MSDSYKAYTDGLQRLINQLTGEQQSDAEALQHRLTENLEDASVNGDTDTLRHDRTIIIRDLSKLTRKTLGMSFRKYCGLDQDSHDQNSPTKQSAKYLIPARTYITSACKYVIAMQKAIQKASKLFLNEEEIWPQQCQDVINAFQAKQHPLLSDNLPFSSLVVKLFYVSDQVRQLIQLILRFSPYGREKSVKARNLRRDILKKLEDVNHHILPTIDLINSTGASVNHPHKCTLIVNDAKDIL